MPLLSFEPAGCTWPAQPKLVVHLVGTSVTASALCNDQSTLLVLPGISLLFGSLYIAALLSSLAGLALSSTDIRTQPWPVVAFHPLPAFDGFSPPLLEVVQDLLW